MASTAAFFSTFVQGGEEDPGTRAQGEGPAGQGAAGRGRAGVTNRDPGEGCGEGASVRRRSPRIGHGCEVGWLIGRLFRMEAGIRVTTKGLFLAGKAPSWSCVGVCYHWAWKGKHDRLLAVASPCGVHLATGHYVVGGARAMLELLGVTTLRVAQVGRRAVAEVPLLGLPILVSVFLSVTRRCRRPRSGSGHLGLPWPGFPAEYALSRKGG